MKRKIKVIRIIAIFIAAALFLNNQQILFAVSAAPQEQEADNTDAGSFIEDDGGEEPADENTGGEDEGGSDGDSDADEEPPEDGTGGGEDNSGDGNPGEGNDTGSGENTEEEDTGSGENSGEEDDNDSGENPGEEDNIGSDGKPEEGDNIDSGENPGEGDDIDSGENPGEGDDIDSSGNSGENDDNSDSDIEEEDNQKPEEEVCDHEWVADSETQKLICSKCGSEKSGEDDEEQGEVCEHEWMVDPETERIICIKCGSEKPVEEDDNDQENEEICLEHEWIRDLETLKIVCAECGEESAEEENECPEGGFHIYDLKEEGTGYVCVLCGAEKEALDALDVTLEMYIHVVGEVDFFAVGDADDPASSKLPKTLEELEEWDSKNLIVSSLGDLLVIQKLSEETDFDGYTIQIMERSTGKLESHVSTPKWDLTNTPDFAGIGSKEHPFSGKVVSVYERGLNYVLDRPLFNYLSTDAEVDTMSIEGSINISSSQPQGIIAGILVKGDRDNVTLKNVILDGTVSNAGGAAGMLFGRVEGGTDTSNPINLSYNMDAVVIGRNKDKVASVVSGFHAGGIAGEITGSVEFHISEELSVSDLQVKSVNMPSNRINGEYTWDGTSAAGMYVGAMESGEVIINGASYTINVARENGMGGANGGLAGMMVGTQVSTQASQDKPIIIVGSGVIGKVSGGVIGYYNHTGDGELNLEHVIVDVVVDATGNDAYFAGGVLGRYYRNEDGSTDKTYDLINHVQVKKEVKAWNAAGGIVGFLHGSNLKIGGSGPEKSVIVSGNLTSNSGGQLTDTNINVRGIGGVAGWLSGQYVEVENVAVSSAFSTNAFSAGGIVGAAGKVLPEFEGERKSIIKISNVSVDSAFGAYANHCRGGIFGAVQPGTMAALDGNISINMSSSQSFESENGGIRMKIGHIAGVQNESLIYLEKDASYTRPTGKNWKDDIGSYGGVYRNGSWGEGDSLISYENGGVEGTVARSGSGWVIDSEADFIRLAVMLNTQGNFAANCFDGASKNDLLHASYSITKNMELAESGIYSLNRNDDKGLDEEETFTGAFRGAGGVTINLGWLETAQSNLALFPRAGSGAEISGFTLTRTIDGASKYAAGLVCQIYGSFSANDITADVNIKSYPVNNDNFNNITHYYGGIAGEIHGQGDAVFSAKNIKISGNMEMRIASDNTMVGGLAAFYRQEGEGVSNISVNGFELTEGFHLACAGRKCSGMFTQINEDQQQKDRTRLFMQNIVIHNGASLSFAENTDNPEEPGGGWLGMVWNDIAPDETNHYSIEGITIGDGGAAQDGPSLTAGGAFGGLADTITGRIQLKNINIQNGTFNNNGGKKTGLLFRDGINGLIEIDGYTIAGQPIGETDGNNAQEVRYTGGGSLDEIVAYNTGRDLNGGNGYATGGIVNIIYSGFSQENKVYQNRLTGDSNDRTRYYYNLFGSSFAGEDTFLSDAEKLNKEALVINNDRQMMIWHLSQYMNDSVKRYLDRYYTGGVSSLNTEAEFRGKIDLRQVSYYPTMVTSGRYSFKNSAEIVFYGKEITDKAGAMTPSDSQRQHYMMHSGLFLSNAGTVTVEGDAGFLTLSGSVANLGDNSGALFSGTISDTKNIYRIRLKDLYLAGYSEAASGQDGHAAGLLIGKVMERKAIENGKEITYPASLDLSWIETAGYNAQGRKAASALIGTVGTAESKNISIEFTNMKLDSRKEGIFQYASLIDTNYYMEDAGNRTDEEGSMRRIRYLFTEYAFNNEVDDSKKKPYFPFEGSSPYGNNENGTYTESYVTIGSELAEGIEYWDNDDGPLDGQLYNLPYVNVFQWGTDSVNNTYLPYVHTEGHEGSKEIEVNPKNRAIEKGCGTYEDPYQIEDAKQILALARYLQNKNDYKYLGGWGIHKFESGRNSGNGNMCPGTDTQHKETDLVMYPFSADSEALKDFPTQEQLSQAYYMITEDIDLSAMKNGTDRQIAEDFLGLGTVNMPFRGVIIGKKQDDGTYPTITLPYRRYWTEGTANVNHGLIQYAKGAVVKDLNIKGADDNNTANTGTGVVKVRKMAGGVMACVLGGDNIIDNVTVNLKVVPAENTVQAGAYAGTVEQGSLILRNLAESAAKEFQMGSWNSNTNSFIPGSGEDYPYISGLIGKVEDGCVIYEDNFNGSASYNETVLAHDAREIAGIYKNDSLPVCKHYDIIVASHLDGKIQISHMGTGGDFKAQVQNASQLQVVSMAVNSDAFSICYKEGGYDKKAACRKAAYNNVGKGKDTPAGADSDFNAATTEDDKVYYYPYLYKKYIDFSNSGGWKGTLKEADASAGEYISQLNGATGDITAVMNYELTNNTIYDMSVYGRGFRGIGASYGMFDSVIVDGNDGNDANGVPVDRLNNSFYSDFRGNFNGNGAEIHIEIDRSYDDSVHTAALFNDLLDTTVLDAANSMRNYTIFNFTVTGSVVSVNKNASVITDSGNGNYANRTAAVAGLVRGPWTFENVIVKDIAIEGKGNAGGIVAWIEPLDDQTYTFNDCVVGENTRIDTYGGSAGGVLGVVTQHDRDDDGVSNVSVNLNGCLIQGSESGQVAVEVKNRTSDRTDIFNSGNNNYVQMGAGRSGGLIGYIGRRHVTDSFSDKLAVFIRINGEAGKSTAIEHARIMGAYSSGGVLGEYDSSEEYRSPSSNSAVQTPSGVSMQNIKVSGCEVEGYRWNVNGRDDYFNYGVGGLIGEMRGNNLTVDRSEVANTNVIASNSPSQPNKKTTGMYAGGGIGCLKTRTADISNVTVRGTIDETLRVELELGGQQYRIRAGAADAGGLIGKTVCGDKETPSELTLSGIQIQGMNISVDDRTQKEEESGTFKTTGGVAGSVGGVIGTNKMTLEIKPLGNSGDIYSGAKVEDCMIMSSARTAGGIVGVIDKYYNDNSAYDLRPSDIENVKVTRCIIGLNNNNGFNAEGSSNTEGAGGIYGKIPYYTNVKIIHRLENTVVSGCWIYGHNVGGLLGYADRYSVITSNVNGTSATDGVKILDNSIYGVHAGGAIGRCKSEYVNYIGMDIERNHLQAYRDSGSSAAVAGGLCGWVDADKDNNFGFLDYITIKDNEILAANANGNKHISAGGVFGNLNWTHCYVYRIELINNLIGYSESANGAALLGTNPAPGLDTLQTLFNSADGELYREREVFLIEGSDTSHFSAESMPSMKELRDNTIGCYAGRIGNFIGVYNGSGEIYFLTPSVVYDSNYKGKTRPVTDVGLEVGRAETENNLLSDPYSYRKKVHIIYHDVEESPDEDAEVWNNVLFNEAAGSWKNLFDGISYNKVIEDYGKAEKTDDVFEYLDACRLNVKADSQSDITAKEVYEKLYRNEKGLLLSPLTIAKDKYLPMIVLDTQYGTVDQLLKGVVAALTNVGGVYSDEDAAYAASIKKVTKIETRPMQISEGKIVSGSGQASLGVRESSDKWTVEYKGFDNDGLDGENQTFTLLTITYQWDYTPRTPNGKPSLAKVTRQETINIPVFVVERLTIDTHLKIMEDLVYNGDKVKRDGLCSSGIVIANDSSYTLYSEYIYGASRTKYPVGIEKYVGLSYEENNTTVERGFAEGTKLTLIDICDNNKVYYYTVGKNDHGPYSYTLFEDDDGNSYENKIISKDDGFEVYGEGRPYPNPFETTDMVDGKMEDFEYDDVAVERFLITVDISGVEPEKIQGRELRDFSISPSLSEDLEKKTTLTDHTTLKAAIQPGLSIRLDNKNAEREEEKTWIEGNIKADEEGFVNIWAAIDISADPLYWAAVLQNGGANTIDSANNNKYLELQVYMTPNNSDQEIFLPAGTNVSIEGVRTSPEGVSLEGIPGIIEKQNLETYYDEANTYFYKDGKLEFRMNDLREIIGEEMNKNGYTQGVVRWSNKLTFDFRNADMTEHNLDEYTMHLKLLRTENKDYPTGGERIDEYERNIPAARKQNLACAVETEDLMQLGVNIYENQTKMPHEIDFDFKLDFTGVLTKVEETNQKTAEKYYTVAYRVLEKVNESGTPQYEMYRGSQLELELENDPDGRKLADAVSSSGEKFRYVTYQFTPEEIEKGTKYQKGGQSEKKEEQKEGVIIRSLKLTVKDAEQMDLSNYKIQAIVYVTDEKPDPAKLDLDSITTLTDFFVFTVAKLKTDLDY